MDSQTEAPHTGGNFIFSILPWIVSTVRPRFALIDIGGTQTVEIAALIAAEAGASRATVTASGTFRVSRSSFVFLLVSPETPDLCARLSIDADAVFSHLLSKAAGVVPVFCNVRDARTVFTRATTLVSIADIHSIFMKRAGGNLDFDELRAQISRLHSRAHAHRTALGIVLSLLVVIMASVAAYVQWLAPTPYYDLIIDSDRATFVFAGKQEQIDRLEMAVKAAPTAQPPRVLVVYTSATTYADTARVLAALAKAKIDLSFVEVASDVKF